MQQLDERALNFIKTAKEKGWPKEEVRGFLASKGYDVGIAQPEPVAQPYTPPQDKYSGADKAKYMGRAGAEGLTFGLGDIVAGATNTVMAPIGKTVNTIREGTPLSASDFNPIQNFKEGRGDFVREQQQFAQAHPALNFVGELGGGLITGAAGAGKKLITTAGKQGLKALAKEGAREGSKFGLAYGAGSGLTQDAEKLSVSNALKGGAEGLITGAALGAVAPVAVTGTGRGVQRFLGTKGYAQRAADEIFKEAGGKEIGQVVRTEKGTRALKEAIKADDEVARAVRDVSDQKLIDSADKTKDIINNTLGVDNIINARNQARAFYDDVVNNSTTKIPQSIYSNKGTKEALSKAISEDYSGELAQKGPNSLAVAQKAKEKLDDMIEASYEIGDYGVRKPTSKTQDLIAVKNAFVRQLDAIAPEYKMAREQFTKAVKPYDLLEGLTKTTGRERANTIKSVLTNKNKEAISSVFGKEKAGQLFDTLRAQSIENERFNKLYNAAENKLTKETPKTQGLIREALESFGSIVGNAVDMARLGGATRGRRRIGEILLGMGEKEATRPNLSVSGMLANKLKENKGFAANPFAEDLLAKYTVTPSIYENVINVHTKAGNIENAPQKWMGKTIEEAKKALGFNGKKYTLIKTPIEDININEGHLRHLLFENPSNRREKLFYAVGALKNPNLITKTNERGHTYHNYIKLYKESDSPVSHMQIVKVKDDGNFYVTNFEPTKKQIEQKIKEGQIVYDLSNVSSRTSTKPNIEDIPTMRGTSTADTNSIAKKGKNVKGFLVKIADILRDKRGFAALSSASLLNNKENK